MNIDNRLLQALLVACDASYDLSRTSGVPLMPFPDSDASDDFPMPDTFRAALVGWTRAYRYDDARTGMGAVIYKRTRADHLTNDYIVAMQGTRGLNAVDWNGNLEFGWDKWGTAGVEFVKNHISTLANEDGAKFTGDISFTGQSLGGALAQYALVEYAKARGDDFDSDHVSLVTFNGLGGMSALTKNVGTNFDNVANVATKHYWITNDLVSRLGGGNLNGAGNEYEIEFVQPDGKAWGLYDAHRIESGFYRAFSDQYPSGEFIQAAIPHAISRLDIAGIADVGTRWANIFNDGSTASGEALAKLYSALIVGTARGPQDEVKSLTYAILDHMKAAGQLDARDYESAKQITAEFVVAAANSTGAQHIAAEGLFLAQIMDLIEPAAGANVELLQSVNFQSSIAFLEDSDALGNADGAIPALVTVATAYDRRPQQDLQLGAKFAMMVLGGASVLETPGILREAALRTLVQHREEIVSDVMSGASNVGDWIRQQGQRAIAAGEQAGEVVGDVSRYLFQLAVDVSVQAEEAAEQAVLAAAQQSAKIVGALEDIFKSAGNGAPDFIDKYPDASVDWAGGLSADERRALIQEFDAQFDGRGGGFGGAGASGVWDAFEDGVAEAVEYARFASQKVVVRSGREPNPFDDAAFSAPDDVVAVSVSEGKVRTLTAYLPYAAETGGQHIAFRLEGTAAGKFTVLLDADPIVVGADHEFDLVVDEGRREVTFGLLTNADVDADETLAISAELIDAGGNATHQSHLELNLALDAVSETAPQVTTVVAGTALDDNRLGTGGRHEVQGTAGSDRVQGLAGRDEVNGGGGNDIVEGGLGIDVVAGNDGDDLVFADGELTEAQLRSLITSSATTPTAGAMPVKLYVTSSEWLEGGLGDDTVVGTSGNDLVFGGGGSDLLVGGAGHDLINGDDDFEPGDLTSVYVQPGVGSGAPFNAWYSSVFIHDHAIAVGAGDEIHAGSGDDAVYGELGSDTIWGDDGNDTISGGEADDAIFGGNGDDRIARTAG